MKFAFIIGYVVIARCVKMELLANNVSIIYSERHLIKMLIPIKFINIIFIKMLLIDYFLWINTTMMQHARTIRNA